MTDQPMPGSVQDAAAAVTPLAPPAPSMELRLDPPAAAATPVSTTAAPRMAPAVPEAALPGLDAKVESYVTSLLTAAPKSPQFEAKANDVRLMGDDDIRRAAE